MACNSATCQSGGCYNADYTDQQQLHEPKSIDNTGPNLCVKCKANESIGSRDDERFCADCFRSNLFAKFRHAVNSNAMITPSDNVLVAFSGGPSSRVVLQFVHDMQHRAQKNYEASRDRSLPVFGVGVAFIDTSAFNPVSLQEINKAVEEIKSIVSGLAPPMKKLHIVPIESICSSNVGDGRDGLRKLLDVVDDATGREDFLQHLQTLSLQKIASENGYNRLVLGTCTSRIASHVITATVKGQGYSLPADIQYVDARWEVPVALPLRDCQIKELNMLCRLDGLKTVEVLHSSHSSINGLVSNFVAKLQEENPSRECTIVRTAGKLIPFNFNRIPEISDHNVPLATRRRQKRLNLKSNDSLLSESFCLICNGPLNRADFLCLSSLGDRSSMSDFFKASCCSSCQFQIIPKDPRSMEQFFPHLPQPLAARAKHDGLDNFSSLRAQIQDCLLQDFDDET